MPQKEHPNSSAGPQTWKCGGPFQYPLPRPNGDPWEVLLEPYLRKDKIRCDTWKDEVQTLLIFAGLFSSVVTSFVVNSVQSLQENQNDVSATLLARIADHFDNNTVLSNASPPTSFHPSASSIRINVLWFISLILSLSTVLVGIVALQWLREHQRYTDRISPKEWVAAFHMREEALERWRVPHIFTALPLLLQLALVLFFVGVADYLCELNLTVGIPVTLVIALSLFFLVATTMLPTLQLFLLALKSPSGGTMEIPAQCAYKSPQSWAMHRLLARMFSLGNLIYAYSPFPKPSSWELQWIPLRFGLHTEQESWITFDSWWLKVRNCYSMFNHGIELYTPRQCLDDLAPQHDVSEMLKATIETYTADANTVLAAYQCFHTVSRDATLSAQQNVRLWHDMGPVRRIQLLRCQYWPNYPLKQHPRPIDSLGLRVMHEEHLAFFLWSPSRLYPEALSRDIGAHLLELRCRILQFEFIHNRLRMLGKYQKTLLDHIYQYYRIPSHSVTVGPAGGRVQHISVPDDVVNASIEQLLLILRDFFEDVDAEYETWFMNESQQDEYGVRSLRGFLEIPMLLLSQPSRSPSTDDDIFGSILQAITLKLDIPSEKNDFLFFAATHFLYEFFPSGNDDLGIRHRDLVGTLLRSLSRYETRLQLEHHPWTVQEPSLWFRNYLWEDPGRYRIGTWSKILKGYEAQLTGANVFDMPNIVNVSWPVSHLVGASYSTTNLEVLVPHSQTKTHSIQE